MIFVSVGTVLPFDRLIDACDDWARDNPHEPMFLQIGGGRAPHNAPSERLLSPDRFRGWLAACDLFVAHAGVGSIVPALDLGKPMLVLPRLPALGEHTTDHQVQTARRFADRDGVRVMAGTGELRREMSLACSTRMAASRTTPGTASPELIAGVRRFLDQALAARR